MTALNFMPVEVHFKPGKNCWIASCPSLDVITQGETFEKAQENLGEALELFIESCLSRGTLQEVLRQAGFTKTEINSVNKAAKKHFPTAQSCRAQHPNTGKP